MAVYIIIPARYESTRLPGKPLRMLAGKTLLEHVYDCARSCAGSRIIVATDDERIAKTARNFGADVCMTLPSHTSGTSRIAEVIEQRAIKDSDIVVNLQGDEPLMPAKCVLQVANLLLNTKDAVMSTLSAPIQHDDDINNPNIVKVVTNKHGHALYFSRASIPFLRDQQSSLIKDLMTQQIYQRHIGLYAYRAGYVKNYVKQQPAPIEDIEKLEQLRILWHGDKIVVGKAEEIPGPGVDTEQELQTVEKILLKRNKTL